MITETRITNSKSFDYQYIWITYLIYNGVIPPFFFIHFKNFSFLSLIPNFNLKNSGSFFDFIFYNVPRFYYITIYNIRPIQDFIIIN